MEGSACLKIDVAIVLVLSCLAKVWIWMLIEKGQLCNGKALGKLCWVGSQLVALEDFKISHLTGLYSGPQKTMIFLLPEYSSFFKCFDFLIIQL